MNASVVPRTLGMIRAGHNPKYLIQTLQKAVEALSSVEAEGVVLFLGVCLYSSFGLHPYSHQTKISCQVAKL